MTKNQILGAVDKIKRGAFVKIVYRTELPMLAAAKKQGVSASKITEKVVRLGVDYNNIKAVAEKEATRTTPKREVTSWCHWEIPNILAQHNTKEDMYLAFATVNGGSHTKTQYMLNGVTATKQEVESANVVIPSYFKSSGDIPEVQRVNINNIIQLGECRA